MRHLIFLDYSLQLMPKKHQQYMKKLINDCKTGKDWEKNVKEIESRKKKDPKSRDTFYEKLKYSVHEKDTSSVEGICLESYIPADTVEAAKVNIVSINGVIIAQKKVLFERYCVLGLALANLKRKYYVAMCTDGHETDWSVLSCVK